MKNWEEVVCTLNKILQSSFHLPNFYKLTYTQLGKRYDIMALSPNSVRQNSKIQCLAFVVIVSFIQLGKFVNQSIWDQHRN